MLKVMYERLVEEKLFMRWIPYQFELNFEEFKEKMKDTTNNASSSNKSIVDIMKGVNKIIKAMGGK